MHTPAKTCYYPEPFSKPLSAQEIAVFYHRFLGLALIGALAACSQPTDTPTAGGPATREPETVTGLAAEFGIGDVQFHLTPQLTVSQRSLGPAVDERQYQSQFKHLTRAEATVSTMPEELWLNLAFNGASKWPGYAVVVNATVFADQRPLESFQYVLTPDTLTRRQNFEFDLLQHLEQIPPTVLVHAEAQYILVKTDDPAAVTPDTVTAADGDVAEKVSNPLRVNFPVQETTPSISSL